MAQTLDYLNPEVAAALGSFELVAKFVVEGFITGLHKSPYHGFSVEFAEHRPYMPGDAIRNIDWKLFARTDRHFVKQFEEETNLKAYIILDRSASMNYTGDPKRITKYKYASILAASLAYLLNRQQDAVGLGLYDEEVRLFMPARLKSSYLREILKAIQTTQPSEKTKTASALRSLLERIKRRGLVIVISDLLGNADEIISSLKLLRHAGHEVIVFQVLDPIERNFALDTGDVTIIDMETGETMKTQPVQLQREYQRAMERHCTKLHDELTREHIDYVLIDTSVSFDVPLREYLYKRRMIG
jgi:uncharacterized protein (DUF58 family)